MPMPSFARVSVTRRSTAGARAAPGGGAHIRRLGGGVPPLNLPVCDLLSLSRAPTFAVPSRTRSTSTFRSCIL